MKYLIIIFAAFTEGQIIRMIEPLVFPFNIAVYLVVVAITVAVWLRWSSFADTAAPTNPSRVANDGSVPGWHPVRSLGYAIYKGLQRMHHRKDSLTFPFGGSRGDFIHLSNGAHYVLRRSVSAKDAPEMGSILRDPEKARPISADQIDTSGIFVRPVRGFGF